MQPRHAAFIHHISWQPFVILGMSIECSRIRCNAQVELDSPLVLGSEVAITDAEGNVMAASGGAGAVLAVISADDQHWSDYIRAAPAACARQVGPCGQRPSSCSAARAPVPAALAHHVYQRQGRTTSVRVPGQGGSRAFCGRRARAREHNSVRLKRSVVSRKPTFSSVRTSGPGASAGCASPLHSSMWCSRHRLLLLFWAHSTLWRQARRALRAG